MNLEEMTLDLEQTVDVNANLEDTFKALLNRFGKGNHTPSGESLDLEIEPFARADAGFATAAKAFSTFGGMFRYQTAGAARA